MKILLTISKEDLEPCPSLSKRLATLSANAQDKGSHCVFQPADGKEIELVDYPASKQKSFLQA